MIMIIITVDSDCTHIIMLANVAIMNGNSEVRRLWIFVVMVSIDGKLILQSFTES